MKVENSIKHFIYLFILFIIHPLGVTASYCISFSVSNMRRVQLVSSPLALDSGYRLPMVKG